jgi:hypothetical protein
MQTANTRVRFFFGDADHDFALTLGGLEELQTLTDAGPQVLHDRFVTGAWRLKDITETVRLGLIGGGMPPQDAARMLKTYGYPEQPLATLVLPARLILAAALVGVADDPPGKSSGVEAEPSLDPSPMADGASASSMPPEPPSA